MWLLQGVDEALEAKTEHGVEEMAQPIKKFRYTHGRADDMDRGMGFGGRCEVFPYEG